MRYFGSKKSLVESIGRLSLEISPNGVFCDPFGGIGTVGGYMKSIGYTVVTGDILTFPHYYQRTLLEYRNPDTFSQLYRLNYFDGTRDIEKYMNQLAPKSGWIVDEYCEKRKFFTNSNGRKIQACFEQIIEWKSENIINTFEYIILITSLINSFDRVANTAGTYYAYLKHYYPKALKNFSYEILHEIPGTKNCKSSKVDAEKLVLSTPCDILYLDPPYNNRDYQRYYHLPETMALGIIPTPNGKSGVYVNQVVKSKYNRKSDATLAFESLISSSKAKGIIFHYTDNGLIEMGKAKSILAKKGKVEEFYFDCKGYSVKKESKNSVHHILRCKCESTN